MRAMTSSVIPMDWRTVPPASRNPRLARWQAARTSAVVVGFGVTPASRWAALMLARSVWMVVGFAPTAARCSTKAASASGVAGNKVAPCSRAKAFHLRQPLR